ncbi:MAG: DNA-directed RNA polymerase subunit omega [Schleiferiaceae bacterium]|jgi:DNA-directed RNA polymerase subunit K/omega|nr:DNA-directed RNA polymerase subunit omega [Schleiferiaceae bacterium]
MDYKNATAAKTTETQNPNSLDAQTNNIYEAVALIGKRSEQINDTIREELHAKLQEFASHTENLEEIFENKEQIEISKFYENLPKPNALATEEWKNGEIYIRYPETEK